MSATVADTRSRTGFESRVLVDHGRREVRRDRGEADRRDQRGQPARRVPVVRRRQRRTLLRLGGVGRPEPVHRRRAGYRSKRVPGRRADVHELRGHAVLAAVPHRHDGDLLQPRSLREGGADRPAEDDRRAHRGREDAHRVQRRRLDQGRRVRAGDRLLLLQQQPGEPRPHVRGAVPRRGRQPGVRVRPGLGGDVRVAARLHRRGLRRRRLPDRRREAAEVRGRRRQRVGQAAGLPAGQGRHDDRRGMAERLLGGLRPGSQLRDRPTADLARDARTATGRASPAARSSASRTERSTRPRRGCS